MTALAGALAVFAGALLALGGRRRRSTPAE
jgi:hypothetical protein